MMPYNALEKIYKETTRKTLRRTSKKRRSSKMSLKPSRGLSFDNTACFHFGISSSVKHGDLGKWSRKIFQI
ncbi:hypothetical protein ACN38_g8829 [Penicillium nordicum]|uniref:Uncharacterized protein n=1 Tax=Penicillium nordicum TaxID=229535 RepID=A0A0M8NWK5_9EURO|nr:hypothetical protein ACN38_g8829 [Penicillium nordicum]